MDESPFKIGDIVRLKSGGPKMTISDPDTETFDSSPNAECRWFAGNKSERASFPWDAIELVPEEEKK